MLVRFPNLTGSWFDGDNEIYIFHDGNSVEGKYAEVLHVTDPGFPGVVYDATDAFRGVMKDRTHHGEWVCCAFGSGWKDGPGLKWQPLQMRLSNDGTAFLACVRMPNNTPQKFTMTRAYTPVEIKLRIFIPSPAVRALPEAAVVTEKLVTAGFLAVDPVFKGDDRSFSYDEGTHRIGQRVTVCLDPILGNVIIDGPDCDFGTTYQYDAQDAHPVYGKPPWWWDLNEDAAIPSEGSHQVTGENNWVEVKKIEDGEIQVGLHVNEGETGRQPGRFIAQHFKAIIADIWVGIKQEKRKVAQYNLAGAHTCFPAFELYLNGNLVYHSDPEEKSASPNRSLGQKDCKVPEDQREWKNIDPWSPWLVGPEDQQDVCEGLPERDRRAPGGAGGRLSP